MAETLKLITIFGALVTLISGSYQLHFLRQMEQTPKRQYITTCILMVTMVLTGINSLFITAWTLTTAIHLVYVSWLKPRRYGNYSRQYSKRAGNGQKQYQP